MDRPFSRTILLKHAARLVVVLTACSFISDYRANGQGELSLQRVSEQKVARSFESIRKSPPRMLEFLLQMPKGGDLHNHLSGAVYAESYIQWSADNGLCINTMTMTLSPPPANAACDPNSSQPPASSLLKNST